MKRLKTFFKYFLIVAIFFVISNILVFVIPNTNYKVVNCNIATTENFELKGSAKATNINGIINFTVKNKTEKELTETKYVKVECYTKRDVLVQTKYIEIGKIEKEVTKGFEIGISQSKIARVELSIVDQMPENIKEHQKDSDPMMSLSVMIAAIIGLYIIL